MEETKQKRIAAPLRCVVSKNVMNIGLLVAQRVSNVGTGVVRVFISMKKRKC